MSYFQKYLKYKQRYLNLSQKLNEHNQQTQQLGGGEDYESVNTSDISVTPTETFNGTEVSPVNSLDSASDSDSLSDSPSDKPSEGLKRVEKHVDSDEDYQSSEDSDSKKVVTVDSEDYQSSEEKHKDSDKSDDSDDTDKAGDDESEDAEDTVETSETELATEQKGGGRFFNQVMDQLSISVRSYDLEKDNFDSDLSSLSGFSL